MPIDSAVNLRACFPYYGYKGAVSADIWRRLGDVPNYVEPFAGSLAVLLQRPGGPGRREVVNDKYGLLVNFWRAVRAVPQEVAKWAIWVSSESDLHARNACCRMAIDEITPRLEGDPEWYDARLAGYWCYVQCSAIGEAAFAKGPWIVRDEMLVHSSTEIGIRRSVPCNFDRGIQRAIPFHSNQGIFCESNDVFEWMERLSLRLQGVRILCGNWARAVRPTYTTQHGLTGITLDPPYVTNYRLYANSDPLADEVGAWCLEHGSNPQLRIALCCYEDTIKVDLVGAGWDCQSWVSRGGRVTSGGQSDANRRLERILYSPHCLPLSEPIKQMELF